MIRLKQNVRIKFPIRVCGGIKNFPELLHNKVVGFQLLMLSVKYKSSSLLQFVFFSSESRSFICFPMVNMGCINSLFSCQVSDATAANDEEDKEILQLTTKSAVIFVITASTFLVLLYLFMSSWFVWLLIVLFCIGGIEVDIDFSYLFAIYFLIQMIQIIYYGDLQSHKLRT